MQRTLPLVAGIFGGKYTKMCLRVLFCYLFVRCGPYSSLCCGLGHHALHNTLGVYVSLICVYLWKLEYGPKGDIQSSPLRGGGAGVIIRWGIRSKMLEPCS